MKDFDIIDKEQVWELLRAGKKVLAVVFYSDIFHTGIYDLKEETLRNINLFYKEVNTIFAIKKEHNKTIGETIDDTIGRDPRL